MLLVRRAPACRPCRPGRVPSGLLRARAGMRAPPAVMPVLALSDALPQAWPGAPRAPPARSRTVRIAYAPPACPAPVPRLTRPGARGRAAVPADDAVLRAAGGVQPAGAAARLGARGDRADAAHAAGQRAVAAAGVPHQCLVRAHGGGAPGAPAAWPPPVPRPPPPRALARARRRMRVSCPRSGRGLRGAEASWCVEHRSGGC